MHSINQAIRFLDKLAGSLFVLSCIISILVFYSGRNLPLLFLLISFSGTIIGNSKELIRADQFWRSENVLRLTGIMFLLTVPATYTPVDICVRCGDRFHVEFLPIIHSLSQTMKLEEEGKTINSDFVAYHNRPAINHANNAVVFIVPGNI